MRGLVTVLVTSLGGVLMTALGAIDGALRSSSVILLLGVTTLALVTFLTQWLRPRHAYHYMFVVFGFTCAIDAVIAATIADWIRAADCKCVSGEEEEEEGRNPI